MITYVLMMMITEFLVINTSKWWDPFVSIPFNTLFYVAVSWVICLLVSFTGKTISKYIHVLLHVVIFSYTISNIFLSVVFHRHWDAFTLQFLRETNLREATEFIQGFIFDVKTLLFVLPSIIFFVVEYLLAKRVSCVPAFPKSKKLCAAMCCVLLLLLGNLYYFQQIISEIMKSWLNIHRLLNAIIFGHFICLYSNTGIFRKSMIVVRIL